MAQSEAPVGQRFWKALSARDAEGLARCYADDATFRDPVFRLADGQVRNMWRMLFGRANDLRIDVLQTEETADGFAGTWSATYTFTATGRIVRNRIHTTAIVRDGRIAAQRDRFPFWSWSGQALGAKGLLLGWTPIVKLAVRRQAARGLASWSKKAAGAATSKEPAASTRRRT